MIRHRHATHGAVLSAPSGSPEVRAFAFYDVLWNGARLVSLALGGILAELASVRIVYVGGGVLLLGAAVVGFTTPVAPEGGRTRDA